MDAPWYAAPSIRGREQSHAHVARKSTPINSDRAFPPCAVSAPRRPSSRRLEKKSSSSRSRSAGRRPGHLTKERHREDGSRRLRSAPAQHRGRGAPRGGEQQHAGSQQRASSQPLAGAMVVGMVDTDGLPLLGRVRMVGVSSGGVVVLDRYKLSGFPAK